MTDQQPVEGNSSATQESVSSAPSPRLYTQAEYQQGLDSVASKVRKESADRVRQADVLPVPSAAPSHSNSNPSVDVEALAKAAGKAGMQEMLSELQAQQAAEEKRKQETEVQNLVGEYRKRLAEGAKKHENFKAVTETVTASDLPFDEMPYLVTALMKHPEHTADLVYELAQSPSQALALQQAYSQGQGYSKAADAVLKQILDKKIHSQSSSPTSYGSAPAPLDEITHSPSHTGKNAQSVDDYLALYDTE